MGGDRYVHLFLVVIISQCTHISKHRIVYLKYIQFSFAINKQTNKMETGYCQGSGPFLWACFPASLTLHRRGRLTQGMAVGWAYVCVAASGGPYVVLSVSVFQTSARSLSLSFAFPYLSVSLSLPVFCDRSCFDSTQQKGRLTQKDSEKKKRHLLWSLHHHRVYVSCCWAQRPAGKWWNLLFWKFLEAMKAINVPGMA